MTDLIPPDTAMLLGRSIEAVIGEACGTVLVLGDSSTTIKLLALNPKVDKVFAVTLHEHVVDSAFGALNSQSAGKIEHVEVSPWKVLRRDVDYNQVDFLYANLWSDPWAKGRIDFMSHAQREFRSRRTGYVWQEIDIAATWQGAGNDLDQITVSAIDMFRMETAIQVAPRTDAYVSTCRGITLELIEQARAARAANIKKAG